MWEPRLGYTSCMFASRHVGHDEKHRHVQFSKSLPHARVCSCDFTPISRGPHKSSHAYISVITGAEKVLEEPEDCKLGLPSGLGDQTDIRIHDIEMILLCWGISYLLLILCHGRHSTRAVTLPMASYDPSLPATTFVFSETKRKHGLGHTVSDTRSWLRQGHSQS